MLVGSGTKPSFAGKMSRVVLEVDVNGEELFVVDKVLPAFPLPRLLLFLIPRLLHGSGSLLAPLRCSNVPSSMDGDE
jgi:hypothetical protein